MSVDREAAERAERDAAVVTDQGIITSRNPGDLPAFCREMCRAFAA